MRHALLTLLDSCFAFGPGRETEWPGPPTASEVRKLIVDVDVNDDVWLRARKMTEADAGLGEPT